MTADGNENRFADRYGRWAVIAGGSDGIGAAFAWEVARRGLDVALIARREDTLAGLAERLRAETAAQVRTISLDLTRPDVGEAVAAATLTSRSGSSFTTRDPTARPPISWTRMRPTTLS
jgi:NADP-dependent 3-hydroxy acid dehydrogenase YdfG